MHTRWSQYHVTISRLCHLATSETEESKQKTHSKYRKGAEEPLITCVQSSVQRKATSPQWPPPIPWHSPRINMIYSTHPLYTVLLSSFIASSKSMGSFLAPVRAQEQPKIGRVLIHPGKVLFQQEIIVVPFFAQSY